MKLKRVDVNQIINDIDNERVFEVELLDGSISVKIASYVPYCCLAIHNGSGVRTELLKKMALNDYQRWYEEDPHTGDFIKSLPITIICNDSRYEYDLNRSAELCIYDDAWGKNVWTKKLTTQEKKQSRLKHANFYKIIDALITKLEGMFDGCAVYDIHSYNHRRWEREVPLFNVGTAHVDKLKFADVTNHWLEVLGKITLPDCSNVTEENDVFFGRGYCAEYIKTHFHKTLVLPTEIKKIYCDELNGDVYPKLVRLLQLGFKQAILENANYFCQKLEKWHHISSINLLQKSNNHLLLKIDKDIYSLLKNIELLAEVNPINTSVERSKFFKSKFSEPPVFKYNPVKINSFRLKQQLLSLPTQDIQDVSIRYLYRSVINAFFDKIDIINSLNTDKFLYNSMRYFGRPSKKDLQNANYILSLPNLASEIKKEPIYNAQTAMDILKNALIDYGITAKVELSNRVISQIMVLNSKKSVLIQPQAKFKAKELQALIEHEIGVHVVTTINSQQQQLKIFNLGLSVNTSTQEGLAILAEYLSGNITLERLKKFALRVIIVDYMCNGASFIDCFNVLKNDYQVDADKAFSIVARVFRGGGFTKDYLYLSGFISMLRFWEDHNDLTPLLVGKTSLPFYSTIDEMIGREMITPPTVITKSFLNPQIDLNNQVYSYIFSGLK